MKRLSIVALILCACGLAHGQCSVTGVGTISASTSATWQCGLGVVVSGLENAYCTKGGLGPTSIEMTEGTPTWGATDDLATLPSRCMYTGLDATPSPGNVTPVANTAALTAALSSMACGDTLVLTAGVTYVGEFVLPNKSCDGAHWITVRSSGTTNANFPGEGVRATPCIANISNDAVNGRNAPGYPDYPCPSFGTVLSARIQQGTSPNDQAISFVTGANHYRFIGIEFAKDPSHSADTLIKLSTDGVTLGANHIIFDRSLIHGDQWTPASGTTNEAQGGIKANNSQWIALINSSDYDTYCNASCPDSQAYAAGTGAIQDGPHKFYNSLMASSGETFIFGGGGQGTGTPTPADFEARSNHFFKPLTWMVPVNACLNLRDVIPKNLGEFKNMSLALLEGNVYENVWQGCQGDQSGYAQLFNPANQNNHAAMTVNYDGSNIVTTTSNFTHNFGSSPLSGNPVDPVNCPPGGCILEDTVNYRFCNGVNGCDQSGVPNLKCGQGANAGLACTTNAQCPQSYCAPTTSARLTTAPPFQANPVSVNACVPGDCPDCKNKNITWRFNEIINTTNGVEINTGLSSHCRDQASGMSNVSIHDNKFSGLSRDMSNGNDPYSGSTAFVLSNGSFRPAVISFVGVRHNTVAIEEGNQSGVTGFGNQIDHTDIEYMEGLALTDNVAPASYGISRTSGSNVTKGIGGNAGLANTFAVNSCKRYLTTEIPDGTVQSPPVPPPPVWPPQDYTFPGLPSGGTNYLVSLNGQYTAITSQAAGGFHVTATVNVGDTIVVRDLNDCNWTFAYNVLGKGVSGVTGLVGAGGLPELGSPGLSPNFAGSGVDQSPYPSIVAGVPVRGTLTVPDSTSCGAGNTQQCILNEDPATGGTPGIFMNNFVSWLTGRGGNYAIKNTSPFLNTASDSLSRRASGKSPGADFVLLAAKQAGVRGTTFIPALTISTTTLPSGTHGVAYNAQLQASFGASQYWDGYKSWWVETISSACAGNCGSLNNGATHSGIVISRSGAVNGPLDILTVSRTGCPAACLSNYTVTQTITGVPPGNVAAWEVGQVASMAGFLDLDKGICDAAHPTNCDSSFNNPCTITAATSATFSCAMTNGVNFNIPSHGPNSPQTCGVKGTSFCDVNASFAPISAGTYTFWVGARDGAFQVARKQISITIN